MERIFYLILLLLISFAGYSQTNNKKAKEYYDNGCDKVFKRNYTEAITDFSEALKRDSGFIQAYENRGVAKYYLQDYRGAITDFTKALEINPNDYNTRGRRGWAKFYIQDYEGAMDDFNRVIKYWSGEKDQRSKAFYWRGLVEIDLGQKDSGCLDLSKAGKLGYAEANEAIKRYCQ